MEDNNNKGELTPKERKLLLKEYLTRLQEIAEEEKPGESGIIDIEAVLTEVNILEKKYPITERVDHPDETLNDILICKNISDLMLKHVHAIDVSEKPYQGAELASAILNFLDDDEDNDDVDFTKLIPFVNNAINEVPQLTTLFGTIDITVVPEIKQKEPREKKQQQAHATKKKLLKVVDAEKVEEGIDNINRFLLEVLRSEYEYNDHQPIDYYKYIIDSSSFEDSVNNMFYTSFLVRDGKAKIDVNPNGKPTIEPVKARTLKEFRRKGGQNTQMITSIDMDFWETCGIKEGYLQKRKREEK